MSVKIKNAKLWKTGKGIVLTIPKAFIKNGIMDQSKKYDLELTESEIIHFEDNNKVIIKTKSQIALDILKFNKKNKVRDQN